MPARSSPHSSAASRPSLDTVSAAALLLCSAVLAAASSPRLLMLALIWWARSRRASPRTTSATPLLSPTMLATTSVTLQAWALTCSAPSPRPPAPPSSSSATSPSSPSPSPCCSPSSCLPSVWPSASLLQSSPCTCLLWRRRTKAPARCLPSLQLRCSSRFSLLCPPCSTRPSCTSCARPSCPQAPSTSSSAAQTAYPQRPQPSSTATCSPASPAALVRPPHWLHHRVLHLPLLQARARGG